MQEYYRYQKVHKIVANDEVLVIFNPKKCQSIFQVPYLHKIIKCPDMTSKYVASDENVMLKTCK